MQAGNDLRQNAAVAGGDPAPSRVAIETPDDACRLDDATQIGVLLRSMVAGDVPVNLSASGGVRLTTALWAEDASSQLLVFSVVGDDAAAQALAQAGHGAAVANLDNVEVRFELHTLRLVRGRDSAVLHARYPTELYRYQRREGFRVQPLDHSQPTMRLDLRHTGGSELELAVVDMSHGGVALRLPADVQPPAHLTTYDAVLELDQGAEVHIGLRVVRIDPQQHLLGCEITQVAADDARALQRYIDHTQRRRRMLVL